ncbi:MAG TPA: hypothetical protein ENJ18_10010 [Nannocystis exedens]|nr:hypothetical protein [Nannocystis exedens]
MLKRLTCPSCNARLDPPGSAAQVTCSYCGTTSIIEQPGTTSPPPGVQVAEYKLPFWLYVCSVPPLLGILWGSCNALCSLAGGQPLGLGRVVHWDSHAPFELRDLNGDTNADIIGRVHTFEGSDMALHYAAFDGQSGRQLWITPSLGNVEDATHTLARTVGDTLVASDSRGQLHGFSLTDGAARWTVDLGERTKYICAGTRKEATVITVDEVSRILNPADGSFRPSPTNEIPENCDLSLLPVGSYGSEASEYWPSGDTEDSLKTPPGSKFSSVFGGPDGYQVALGVKYPGSEVPLVAVFQGGELRWSNVIPEADPLAAATGPVELALIQDGILVVSYELAKRDAGRRVSARDLASGKLLWDVQMPHSTEVSSAPPRITADNAKLYIPHWAWLEVLDLHSGEHLYTVGRRR